MFDWYEHPPFWRWKFYVNSFESLHVPQLRHPFHLVNVVHAAAAAAAAAAAVVVDLVVVDLVRKMTQKYGLYWMPHHF